MSEVLSISCGQCQTLDNGGGCDHRVEWIYSVRTGVILDDFSAAASDCSRQWRLTEILQNLFNRSDLALVLRACKQLHRRDDGIRPLLQGLKVWHGVRISADVIDEDIGIDEVGQPELFPSVTADAIHIIQAVLEVGAVLPQTESFEFHQLGAGFPAVLAVIAHVHIDFSPFFHRDRLKRLEYSVFESRSDDHCVSSRAILPCPRECTCHRTLSDNDAWPRPLGILIRSKMIVKGHVLYSYSLADVQSEHARLSCFALHSHFKSRTLF